MPNDLNQPTYNGEFAEFLRLEMDGHGRGRLIARAALNRTGAARQRLYAYATRDGGRTWSDPMRLSALPRPQAQVLSRIATRQVDDAGIATALQSPPR